MRPITAYTTLAELRSSAGSCRPSPEFVTAPRSLQSVIQSIGVEGYKVTIEAARTAAQRVLTAYNVRTQKGNAHD